MRITVLLLASMLPLQPRVEIRRVDDDLFVVHSRRPILKIRITKQWSAGVDWVTDYERTVRPYRREGFEMHVETGLWFRPDVDVFRIEPLENGGWKVTHDP